jgi:integrase
MGRPRLPARLEQRADNDVYEIRDGQVRISTGTRDRVVAEANLKQYLAGLLAPSAPRGADLSDLLTAYVESRRALGRVSADTTEDNANNLIRHLGTLRPEHVSTEVVIDYVNRRRRDAYKNKIGTADWTLYREIGTLRYALQWGWNNDRTGWFGPEGRLPVIESPVAEPQSRHRWLSKEEARKLLDAATTPHIRLFTRLGLETTARKAAIEQLRWKTNVDVDTGFIDFGPHIGNKRRPRQRLSEGLLEELRAAYEVRATDFVLEWGGRPAGDVKKAFRLTAIRAGFIVGYRRGVDGKPVPITDVTPHVLKHTGISWMVQAGLSYELIGQYSNTSPKMIERVYGHLSPDTMARAHAALIF